MVVVVVVVVVVVGFSVVVVVASRLSCLVFLISIFFLCCTVAVSTFLKSLTTGLDGFGMTICIKDFLTSLTLFSSGSVSSVLSLAGLTRSASLNMKYLPSGNEHL